MADHSRSFGSSLPETTDIVGNFSSEVSDFSDDVSQRLTLDHYMDGVLTDGAANQDGRHRQVTMKALSSNPSTLANTGTVFTKEVDNITELHYKDDSGNVIQITDVGIVKQEDIVFELEAVFSEFVKVTGSVGSISQSSYLDTSISYPSGYTQENCTVISSKIYNTNESAWDEITGFNYYQNGDDFFKAAIILTASDIKLRSTSYYNGQNYEFVLGILA